MVASDSDDCSASTADNKLDDDGIHDEFFLLLHLSLGSPFYFKQWSGAYYVYWVRLPII